MQSPLFRFPGDRPIVEELLNHPFFKQSKHTSLAANFSLTGIDKYNCTKVGAGAHPLFLSADRGTSNRSIFADEELGLISDLTEMSLGNAFEWDFS